MKNIVLIMISFFGLSARAGMLIEPYLGYDSGTQSVVTIADVDKASKSTGSALGVQVGYRFPVMVWVAADVTSLSGENKPNDATAATYKYSGTSMGVVAGYQWHMVRFWAGYGFQDNVTTKDLIDVKFKGTNTKVGLGAIVIPHVSLNVEYVIPKYTSYDVDSLSLTDQKVTDNYSKFDFSVLRVGVSFPFDLGK